MAVGLTLILIANWTAVDAVLGASLVLIVLLGFAMPVELAVRKRRAAREDGVPPRVKT
jgi:hypothetical protein